MASCVSQNLLNIDDINCQIPGKWYKAENHESFNQVDKKNRH